MRARLSRPTPPTTASSSSPAQTLAATPNRERRWWSSGRTPASLAVPALLLLVLLVASACGSSGTGGSSATATPQPVNLKVFAAASLKSAFTKIGTQFTGLHPNVTFTFNFAGSDALAGQITQGAPADVFASANNAQMNVAVKGGQIDSSAVQVFAHNRLVVVIPTSNPGNIHTLQDLAKPGIKIVLADKTVPAGAYALQYLAKANADPSFGSSYQADVLKNVVSYQTDVTSVLNQVALGEADAGIVYTTDAATEPTKLSTITIPDNLNVIAVYPIAPIKGSASSSAAQQFIAYVMSSDGQSVLTSFGFLSATQGPGYTPPAS
jgi:molybdate transport system substrate-binding protein